MPWCPCDGLPAQRMQGVTSAVMGCGSRAGDRRRPAQWRAKIDFRMPGGRMGLQAVVVLRRPWYRCTGDDVVGWCKEVRAAERLRDGAPVEGQPPSGEGGRGRSKVKKARRISDVDSAAGEAAGGLTFDDQRHDTHVLPCACW